MAAEASRQLNEMVVEWVETEGRGMDPRAISMSCIRKRDDLAAGLSRIQDDQAST